MIDSSEKRKFWYNSKAIGRKFERGDKVLILTTNKLHKMSGSWTGPSKIITKISTNYVVEVPGQIRNILNLSY